MNDDWRLQVDFHESSHAQSLIERLEARELQHDLSNAFHDRVIVTRDDDRIFLYTGSREQAERARELVDSLAKQDGWNLRLDLKRWHPTAEDWEDPDKPLPHDDAARTTEREALMVTEREEAEERGYSEFEVRIDVPTRHEAIRLAERLQEEGLSLLAAGSSSSSAPRTKTTPRSWPIGSKTRPRLAAIFTSREPGRSLTPSCRGAHSPCWVDLPSDDARGAICVCRRPGCP